MEGRVRRSCFHTQRNCGWLRKTVLTYTGNECGFIRILTRITVETPELILACLSGRELTVVSLYQLWATIWCLGWLTQVNSRSKCLLVSTLCSGHWPISRLLPDGGNMATTGNGGLVFDPGEGAWEMATTSTDGSRRANYPLLMTGR